MLLIGANSPIGLPSMNSPSGRINSLWLLLLGAVAAIIAFSALLYTGGPQAGDDAHVLRVQCAAGLREPMERIARMYENEPANKQRGLTIALNYGGSDLLLSQLEINKFDKSDLFLAADDQFTDQAKQKGLAAECLPLAWQRPVIVVSKGNPKEIESFDDLLREDVRLVTGNPQETAIGKAVRKQLSSLKLENTDRWQQLEQQIIRRGVFKPTVTDAANDVKIGAIDAAIVWDSTAVMPSYRDAFDVIHLDEFETDPSLVTLCVLNSSPNAAAALKFARYVAARDRGLKVFEEMGAKPVEGDAWDERPQLTFFSGAVNRRSVEKIVADFEAREGITVNTVYDGCGILTGRMKTINQQRTDLGFPDVYMACDVYYLENVKDWFQEPVNVSDTEIVIAVPKGSTKVKGLKDLLEPGVRVAVGEPESCTIGALTRRLLAAEQLYDPLKAKQKIKDEVVVEKTSSALLVPDVVNKHVDAAIAFYTDVKSNLDRVDVVRIDSPLVRAIQPFSIAKTSQHKQLARRLFERIANSPEAFEDVGFHFLLTKTNHTAEAEPPK
jgi:molybdenum ABC transporter molybdate-binding protein